MNKQDDEFSAFNQAMTEHDEFSAFNKAMEEASKDESVSKTQEDSSILDKIIKGARSGFRETVQDPIQTAKDFSMLTGSAMLGGGADELGGVTSAAMEYLPGARVAAKRVGNFLSAITGDESFESSKYSPDKVDEELRKQGFSIPEETFGEKYRSYQQGTEKLLEEAEKRSPIAGMGALASGSLAGGAALTALSGLGKGAATAKTISEIARDQGKAKAALELLTRGGTSVAKALPVMAAESALESKHQLFGEEANIPALLEDVKQGTTFGTAAMLGMGTIAPTAKAIKSLSKKTGDVSDEVGEKVLKIIKSENNPRTAQLEKAYRMGEQLSDSPGSHGARIRAGSESFSEIEQSKIQDIVNTFSGARKKLGQELGESLSEATEAGVRVNINKPVYDSYLALNNLGFEINPKLHDTFNKIQNKAISDIDPIQGKYLLDDLNSAKSYYSTSDLPADKEKYKQLENIRKDLTEYLKEVVPQYRETSERFQDLGKVFDQIISKERKSDLTKFKFKDLKDKGDLALYESFQDMIDNVMRVSETSGKGKDNFNNFFIALDKFQQNEAKRLASGTAKSRVVPNIKKLRNEMIDLANEVTVKKSALQVADSRSLMPSLKEWVVGKVPQTAAYASGYAKTKVLKPTIEATKSILKQPVDAGKQLFNAVDDDLYLFADRLQTIGGFDSLSKSLKQALDSGDSFKKNATLFAIMQNPNSRLLTEKDDSEDNEYVTDKTR